MCNCGGRATQQRRSRMATMATGKVSTTTSTAPDAQEWVLTNPVTGEQRTLRTSRYEAIMAASLSGESVAEAPMAAA